MSLFGAMLCYGAKVGDEKLIREQQYSPWDHICVVVKDPETNKVYALEAALNGIQVLYQLGYNTQLFEVDDRLQHSKAPAIAVRYLRVRSGERN